jgi:hypothetical protein
LDNRKYTALNVAKTASVKQLLIERGSQKAAELENKPELIKRYLLK